MYKRQTPYDASFKGVHILFDKENVQNTLGEYLAANGKTQLHIAETDVYKRQLLHIPRGFRHRFSS